MKPKPSLRLDYTVVLAPCLNSRGKFSDIVDGAYVGGATRMRGLAACCKQYHRTTYILAGSGSESAAMKHHLIQAGCQANLIRVASGPCTYDNLAAVAQRYPEALQSPYTALFSNEWHCFRSSLLWMVIADSFGHLRIPPTPVTFLPAEAFDPHYRRPRGRAFQHRQELERKGRDALLRREYHHKCTGEILGVPIRPFGPPPHTRAA